MSIVEFSQTGVWLHWHAVRHFTCPLLMMFLAWLRQLAKNYAVLKAHAPQCWGSAEVFVPVSRGYHGKGPRTAEPRQGEAPPSQRRRPAVQSRGWGGRAPGETLPGSLPASTSWWQPAAPPARGHTPRPPPCRHTGCCCPQLRLCALISCAEEVGVPGSGRSAAVRPHLRGIPGTCEDRVSR